MLHVFKEEQRLEGLFGILITQNPHECFSQFSEAVASANDIEMRTPNAERARQLLAEAVAYRQQIDAEAADQVARLEEPNMKAVLERADAIGYSTEHLEKIRSLLFDTAEDAFVKLQLKAAVQFKDRERVTRTTIRLKDLFFEKSGGQTKRQHWLLRARPRRCVRGLARPLTGTADPAAPWRAVRSWLR